MHSMRYCFQKSDLLQYTNTAFTINRPLRVCVCVLYDRMQNPDRYRRTTWPKLTHVRYFNKQWNALVFRERICDAVGRRYIRVTSVPSAVMVPQRKGSRIYCVNLRPDPCDNDEENHPMMLPNLMTPGEILELFVGNMEGEPHSVGRVVQVTFPGPGSHHSVCIVEVVE